MACFGGGDVFCCYGELVSGQAYEGISARHRCCLCLKGIDPREGDGEGFYSNLGTVVSKSENCRHKPQLSFFLFSFSHTRLGSSSVSKP